MRAQPSNGMVAGAARGLVKRSSVPGGRSTREPAVGSCPRAPAVEAGRPRAATPSRHPRADWAGLERAAQTRRRGAPRIIAPALPPRRVPDGEDRLRGR